MLEFFENLLRKFNFRWNLTRITGTLHNDQHKFLIIPCSVLLGMRNVSGKSCRESQSKHFMFNNVFIKSYRLSDNVGKIMQSQTGWRWQYGECAYHDMYLKLHTHKHTHTHMRVLACGICNNYYFSTAAMVLQTRLNVMFNVHFLSCHR